MFFNINTEQFGIVFTPQLGLPRPLRRPLKRCNVCADWAMQHAHIRQQHQQQQRLQTIAIYIQQDAERKDTLEHSVDMHALNLQIKNSKLKIIKI